MRKLYVYSLFSQHNQNYVYNPIFAKNERHAIFKLLKFLDENKKIVKKCRLHLIGEAIFKSNGKIVNVTHYLVPKEVHLTKFGKVICLTDYFAWKIKEELCQKVQNLLKNLNIIFQKKKLLTLSVSE